MSSLPLEIIEQDRSLDKQASRAREELSKLRWHWVRDPNGPQIPVTEYARQVGAHHAWVQECVDGWDMIVRGLKPASDLADAHKLAKMSQDQATATDAVAQAEGISVSRAKDGRKEDVRRVREAMDVYAEKHPESTPEDRAEVAQRAAQNISTSRKIEREHRDQLLASQPALLTIVQGELAKAREALVKVNGLVQDAEMDIFPEAGKQQLARSLDEITKLSSDLRILFNVGDWDSAARSL